MSGADETIARSSGTAASRAPGASVALQRGDVVGRYVVLSRIGAGGMGVVFVAYDPELDRKIALKLLHGVDGGEGQSEARHRLVREAQAMARLRHPNVITVHDVGEHGTRVFVAMEFVDGRTLGAWLQETDRPWTDVLETFVAAGRGLAAAHEQGLVHRDFKPDNVMVGADGRVQVMDFGLARPSGTPLVASDAMEVVASARVLDGALTAAGSIVGTPAYMAPEQHGGHDVGTAADQFSFCVALWEGLYGERPFAGATLPELVTNITHGKRRSPPADAKVPTWLRRVCERGLSLDPGQRFASIAELLVALERGRGVTRVRRVAIALGVIALLGLGAEATRRVERARKVAACESEGASIAEVWNDDVRASVGATLRATGVSYAETTAASVMPWLDRHTDQWRRHRTQACIEAEVDGVRDERVLDRVRWCLDDLRLQMDAVVIELGHADAQTVAGAVTLAGSLPPVSPCVDETALARMPEPPRADQRASIGEVQAEIAQARALRLLGKYADAQSVARTALQLAGPIEWPPLIAQALHEEGLVLERSGAYAEAEAGQLDAYMRAAKAGAWHVAEAAASSLVYTVGYRRARPAEGRLWANNAEIAAALAGDPLRLRESNRIGNLALVLTAAGEFAEAEVLYGRSIAIQREALGSEHPRVASFLNNLAVMHQSAGAHAKAKPLFEQALAIREATLGAEHPEVAIPLSNLAVTHTRLGSLATAKAMHERALAIRERALGPEHPEVAVSLNNLGLVYSAMGADAQEEKALHERALAIREKGLGSEHPEVAASLDNLAGVELRMGAPEDALALCERAVAIREKAFGREDPGLVNLLLRLADVHKAMSAREDEMAVLERVVKTLDAHAGVQEYEPEARFRLAQALAETGGDLERARAEAETARAAYVEAGNAPAELAQVQAWLTEHRRRR